MINHMLSGQVMINCLTAEQIKRMSLYKMSNYLEPDGHGRTKIKVELNLSNSDTKCDVINVTAVN